MKFVDILGKSLLGEELSDHHKKVSHKIKLMYKILRNGSFKIDKLIPNMVPFWTGFEMIEDGDALITYELPTKYHLVPGNGALSYKLIISEITINCEKYPGLADDIDVRADILRRLSRKFDAALRSTFNEGEQVKVELWRKPNISNDFENMVNENTDYDSLTKKAPIIYKALKKGSVKLTIHSWDYDTIKEPNLEKEVKFHYQLPDLYKVTSDEFSNNYPVYIIVPEIKISCPEEPELVKQSIRHKILEKVRTKFMHFGLTIFIRPSQFFLKDNGTWTNL